MNVFTVIPIHKIPIAISKISTEIFSIYWFNRCYFRRGISSASWYNDIVILSISMYISFDLC